MAGGLTPSRDGLARIDAWLDGHSGHPDHSPPGRRHAGASVLILQGGREIHFASAGTRRGLEPDGPPFARDTIVRIFSMTKPVTSLVAAMLMEEGRLVLDRPVSDWLDGWDAMETIDGTPCATPTLQQLLTHTAGLTYSFNPSELAARYAEAGVEFRPFDGTLAEQVDALARLPLAFPPGTAWLYSVAIDVVGRIIEVLEGQPLDAVFRDRVFDPLGMDDTAFHLPPTKVDRYADCWTKTDDDPLALYDPAEGSAWREGNVTMFSGGGGLLSTIDDYARFAAVLSGHSRQRLVSPATLSFMRANHLGTDVASLGVPSFAELPTRGMGFGIGGACVTSPAVMGVPGSVGDFGWGGMASTYFWCDPVHDLTCIFFTQLVPSSAYTSRAELKALVHAALE